MAVAFNAVSPFSGASFFGASFIGASSRVPPVKVWSDE